MTTNIIYINPTKSVIVKQNQNHINRKKENLTSLDLNKKEMPVAQDVTHLGIIRSAKKRDC